MESATTKAPENVRPADKVLQALATLAALIDSTIREVKSLDSEFQSRLLQAVHDTESSLQAQTADYVDRARQEVQEELNGRFQNDLRAGLDGLKGEFEIERERFNKELRDAVEGGARLKTEMSELIAEVQQVKDTSASEIDKERGRATKAAQDTEASLQALFSENIERARREVQEQLRSEFEIERERFSKELREAVEAGANLKSEMSELIAEVQQVKDNSSVEIEEEKARATKAIRDAEESLHAQAAENIERARQEVQDELNSKYRRDLLAAQENLNLEFEIERERLNKELLHTVEAASKLEAERSGLISEVQQVKSDSAAEIEKAREEVKAATAKEPAASAPTAPSPSLQQEIDRAETKLQEILKLIDNPATELSTVIRKNVEKSELEAYLKGIRLVLGVKV